MAEYDLDAMIADVKTLVEMMDMREAITQELQADYSAEMG